MCQPHPRSHLPAQTLTGTRTCKKKTPQSCKRTHASACAYTIVHNLAHIYSLAHTHKETSTSTHTSLKHTMWVRQALCELPLSCAPDLCEVLMCSDINVNTLSQMHTHTCPGLKTRAWTTSLNDLPVYGLCTSMSSVLKF